MKASTTSTTLKNNKYKKFLSNSVMPSQSMKKTKSVMPLKVKVIGSKTKAAK